MVMVFYSLLVYIYWNWLKDRGWRALAVAGVLLLTAINAFNRLFFSTHYVTDVVASLGLGLGWSLASLMTVDWYLCGRKKEEV